MRIRMKYWLQWAAQRPLTLPCVPCWIRGMRCWFPSPVMCPMSRVPYWQMVFRWLSIWRQKMSSGWQPGNWGMPLQTGPKFWYCLFQTIPPAPLWSGRIWRKSQRWSGKKIFLWFRMRFTENWPIKKNMCLSSIFPGCRNGRF